MLQPRECPVVFRALCARPDSANPGPPQVRARLALLHAPRTAGGAPGECPAAAIASGPMPTPRPPAVVVTPVAPRAHLQPRPSDRGLHPQESRRDSEATRTMHLCLEPAWNHAPPAPCLNQILGTTLVAATQPVTTRLARPYSRVLPSVALASHTGHGPA